MVALYLGQMPERLAAARAAADRGDADALAGAAHAMKSSSAQLGAARLTALLQGTEDAAERGDVVDASGRLDAVEREYEVFRERLSAATGHGAPGNQDGNGERSG